MYMECDHPYTHHEIITLHGSYSDRPKCNDICSTLALSFAVYAGLAHFSSGEEMDNDHYRFFQMHEIDNHCLIVLVQSVPIFAKMIGSGRHSRRQVFGTLALPLPASIVLA